MFQPGKHSEIETYVGYLQVQIEGLREAAHGLTEEQARETPCRSALSIGGLLKHATYVMTRHTPEAANDRHAGGDFADQARDFMASFALGEGETLAGQLAEFDRARDALLAAVRATDPAAEMLEPAAPWDNRPEPTPAFERFALVHIIEELARHAGHADIIREQLDGAQAGPLHLAATGQAGNDFMRPWTPAH